MASMDSGDVALIQIVDAALAEAARKSGPWLVCRPGCTQCCHGPFAITQLDARRLQLGLAELESSDAKRAARVRDRASAAVTKILSHFPAAENNPAARYAADIDDDDPCPALDPATGTCDLYASRPIICRAFGPPVLRCASGEVSVCELCFVGASDQEVVECQMEIDPDGIESELIKDLERSEGLRGMTMVAFALSYAGGEAPLHAAAPHST